MMEFESFKVVDVFQVKNSGNILSRDIVENSGQTPYLCASSENNAVVIPPKRAASKSRINTSPAFSAGRVSLLKPSYAFALE